MSEAIPKEKTQRCFPRRSASPNVKVTCKKKGLVDASPDLTRVALDSSQAGARLLVTVPMEVGETVVVGLEGPWYKRPLMRPGKVAWSFQVRKTVYAVGIRLEDHFDGDDIQQVTINPVRLDY